MREVTVELLKYPGRTNRTAPTVLLGTDEHGTWLGHTERRLVYLIPHQGWWKARHFPDGGWKVDVATPPQWHGDRVVLEDLALDVRRMNGRVWIEDEDEFAGYVAGSTYPDDVAAMARETCAALAAAMYDEPFRSTGDKWLGEMRGRWNAALLLDMGGVLTRREAHGASRRWEARLGLGAGELSRVLRAAIGPGWEGGAGPRTPEESDRLACDALNVDVGTLFELRVDLMGEGVLDEEYLRIIASLPETTAAAVVSNNGAGVRPLWEAAYDIGSLVDLVVVSGEERVAKPDPLLYQIAAWRLGVPAQRCVFVDDNPANLAGARDTGMVAVNHTESDPAYERVESALAAL